MPSTRFSIINVLFLWVVFFFRYPASQVDRLDTRDICHGTYAAIY